MEREADALTASLGNARKPFKLDTVISDEKKARLKATGVAA